MLEYVALFYYMWNQPSTVYERFGCINRVCRTRFTVLVSANVHMIRPVRTCKADIHAAWAG